MSHHARDGGGPAFPSAGGWSPDGAPVLGMSLRDYFAAVALAKCLEEVWGEEDGMPSAAADAYQIADAMLAERAKGGAP